jgi:TonB family protein
MIRCRIVRPDLTFISILSFLIATSVVGAQSAGRPQIPRVAVLDFGQSATGRDAREALTQRLSANVALVDHDQAMAAANGAGYHGSLNLSLPEARDLGSAIGCDFFILGEADTLRRSPSDGPTYFESYVSIFIVSARTGRLVRWEKPAAIKPSAAAAEAALLTELSADTADRYTKAMLRASEDEKAERARAVEQPRVVIEAMSDTAEEAADGTRPPRPFRRLKPVYPEAAAHAQLEAVVDVFVDVDERGEVSRVDIARWAGYGLDESVLTTVKQLHFFPAMRNGLPIPMRVLLRYNFRKPSESSSE